MAWIKLDDQFTDHPKIVAVGPLAAWLYVCGLTYCGRYLTDGWIPKGQVRKLADVDNPSELIAKLVAIGLWDATEDGYIVHDYLEYNPTREEVVSTREARAEAGRRGGIESGKSKRKAKAIANATAKTKQNQTPSPSPIPLNTNTDKGAKNAPTNFDSWLEAIRKPTTVGEKNGIGVLVQMGQSLYGRFPEANKNTYGRVAGMAKKAGTQSKLAKIFWDNSTKPLTDPLDYLTAVVNGDKPQGQPPPPAKPVDNFVDPSEFFGGKQ